MGSGEFIVSLLNFVNSAHVCWVRPLFLEGFALTLARRTDGDTHWDDKVEERENKSSRNYRRLSHVDGPQFLRRAFTTRHSNNIHRHPPPPLHISKTTHLLGAGEDVRVTGIEDGHGGATEQLTAGGTKLDL